MRLRPLAVAIAAAVSVSALSLTATPALADPAPSIGIAATTAIPHDVVVSAFSPDGKVLYTVTETDSGATLSAVTVASSTVAYQVKVSLFATAIAVSPDGSAVYLGGIGGLAAISTVTHRVVSEDQSDLVLVSSLAVSPDGSTLYAGDFEGEVEALATPHFAKKWHVTTLSAASLALSPDGSKLYLAATNSKLSDSTLSVIDTTTHDQTPLASLDGGVADGMLLSPDGSTLYTDVVSGGESLLGILLGFGVPSNPTGAIVPVAVNGGTVGASIKLSGIPIAFDFSSDGSSLYALSMGSSSVIETVNTIAVPSGTVTSSSKVFGEYGNVATAHGGASYLVGPDGALAKLGEGQKVAAPASVSVTGTVRVGATVTVHAGAWPAGTALKYQWFDEYGTIPGATKSTYKIETDERGLHLQAAVIGTAPGFLQSYATSKATTVAAGKLVTKPVSIIGTVKVGKTVKIKHGAWTTGTKYTVQWYANGKAIKGATKTSLKLATAQGGTRIVVKVTGSKTGYTTKTVASKQTAIVLKKLTVATPKISGTARVGATLHVKAGKWTTGTKFSYQWYASGKKLKGATKTALKLSSSTAGKKITVVVTGKHSGFVSAAVRSKATKAVRR